MRFRLSLLIFLGIFVLSSFLIISPVEAKTVKNIAYYEKLVKDLRSQIKNLNKTIIRQEKEISQLKKTNKTTKQIKRNKSVDSADILEVKPETFITVEKKQSSRARQFVINTKGEEFKLLGYTVVYQKQVHGSVNTSPQIFGGRRVDLRACENIDIPYQEFSQTTYPLPCPGKGESTIASPEMGYSWYYLDHFLEEKTPVILNKDDTYKIEFEPTRNDRIVYLKFKGTESGKIYEFKYN